MHIAIQTNFPPVSDMHQIGVSHADDVFYHFDMSPDACALFTPEDFHVAADLALFFANFALNGDPNPANQTTTTTVISLRNVHDNLF